MMPVVTRRPVVLTDLSDHYEWIAADNPEAAERFKEQARRDFEKLASMPEMGPRHHLRHSELKDLRFWPVKGFTNFLIFYRPISNGIEVIRVLHGARDLPKAISENSEGE